MTWANLMLECRQYVGSCVAAVVGLSVFAAMVVIVVVGIVATARKGGK
jgi:hypothetical protein